jgi:putative ABC transport system permease protein
VIALFFSLLVIERLGLYATLKALGVPSWRLLLGLVVQAVVVAAVALALGSLVTFALAAVIPEEVPVQLEPRRAVVSALLVLVTAALGTALTFRRIARVEPASAIS